MAEKSDLVPHEPLRIRQEVGENAALRFGINVYRDWGDGINDVGAVWDADYYAAVPPGLTVCILNEADKSDPANQLRVFTVRIGERLAYKVTLTAQCGDEREILKLGFLALFMTAVDNAAEIRDAIAAARKEAVAAAT